MTITIQIDLTYRGYTARTTPNSVWVFDPMGATVGHISPGIPGHADMREQIEAIERGLSMARDMIDGITENDLPSGAHWTDAWTDIAPCMVQEKHDAAIDAKFEALAAAMGEGPVYVGHDLAGDDGDHTAFGEWDGTQWRMGA